MASSCGTDDQVSSATSPTKEGQIDNKMNDQDGQLHGSITYSSGQSSSQSTSSLQMDSSLHHVTSPNGFDQYSAEQYRRWNQEYAHYQLTGPSGTEATSHQSLFPVCDPSYPSNPEYPRSPSYIAASGYPTLGSHSYDHNIPHLMHLTHIQHVPVPYPVTVPVPVYVAHSPQRNRSRRSNQKPLHQPQSPPNIRRHGIMKFRSSQSSMKSFAHNGGSETQGATSRSSQTSGSGIAVRTTGELSGQDSHSITSSLTTPQMPIAARSHSPASSSEKRRRKRRRGPRRRKRKQTPPAVIGEDQIFQKSVEEGKDIQVDEDLMKAFGKVGFEGQTDELSTPGTSLTSDG